MSKFVAVVLLLGALLLIVSCAPATTGSDQGSILPTIIFLVLIFAVFYFLMVRPQRKRQKEHDRLVQDLQKGDRVVTAGGIYGEIESISPDSVVIKVESGATMRVARSSVIGKRQVQ